MKKENITFCSFPDFAGNAKVLYEYMISKYKDSMNYIWIVNDEKTLKNLKTKGIKSYLIGSVEFDKYISKTDVFFTTHANLIDYKKYAKDSIYVELWHGIGPKPIGFLDNHLSKIDEKWYKFVSDNIDYFIVPSPMWKIIFSSMFGIDARRIKDIALPVLDEILHANGKDNLNKVLDIDVYKYDKIIMYMPTYKKGCGRELEAKINEKNIINLQSYEDEELIKYLKEKKYLLIIKRHPSDECKYKTINNDYIREITSNMLSEHILNVNSILNASDILITDYSSVGTEYAFLDKPVVYLTTDIEEYKENRGIVLEDFDFWTDRITANTYQDLIQRINDLIGKQFIHKNKNMFFGELKNGGCENICKLVFEGTKVKKIETNINERYKLENKLQEQKKLILKLDEHTKKQEIIIGDLKETEKELKQIKASRGWRLLEQYRKIIHRKQMKNK